MKQGIWKAAALGVVGIGTAWALFGVDWTAPTPLGEAAPSAAPVAVQASAGAARSETSTWSASPFVQAPANASPQAPRIGPAEQMIDIPALQARWAGDPRRDEKISDVVAVTRLQDRIGGIGETLAGLPPEARRGEVEILVHQMQAFAARGVLPKEEVEDVEAQLLALLDPDGNPQDNGQPRRHGPRGFR